MNKPSSLENYNQLVSMDQKLDDYTKDGSVDLHGNPVRRSNSGGWRACYFVVVYEIFERMAFYGISSNLVQYLTENLHQGTVKSSNNVTIWIGTLWITPILGAYVADAHLGRYWTLVISSMLYLLGMVVLTLSVSLKTFRPPECVDAKAATCPKASALQLAVFYGALYTIAVATGGTKPNISTIGADQFDDFDPSENKSKLSFFNWWMFSVCLGTLFASTVLVYIQDNVEWSIGYGIPTLGLLMSIIIFLAGTPRYRHRAPAGSSITRMAKVIVAAIRKRKVQVPDDPQMLYELDMVEYSDNGKFRIDWTPTLRILDRAAVRNGQNGPWNLCCVTQVEETKQMLRLIPILLLTIIPSTVLVQVITLFVKQGTTLNRKIGNFMIPAASLVSVVTLPMIVAVVIYDRYTVPMLRRWTGNPRGISLTQRMGIGMAFHIIIMVTASLVDRYRISVAGSHGLTESGGQIPLSIFILFPQFILMGIADSFIEVAKIEFFYDQAPEGMKSLGTAYAMLSIGIGSFTSSFLLSAVSRISKMNGHRGWILNNLNASHLDYYYALLAILSCANFMIFLVVSQFYVYRAEVSDSISKLPFKTKSNDEVSC